MLSCGNKQIENIRRVIAKLYHEPAFGGTPNAIKRSLAQRFGCKLMDEGGLVLEFPIPNTFGELMRLGVPEGDPSSLLNVYSYNFRG